DLFLASARLSVGSRILSFEIVNDRLIPVQPILQSLFDFLSGFHVEMAPSSNCSSTVSNRASASGYRLLSLPKKGSDHSRNPKESYVFFAAIISFQICSRIPFGMQALLRMTTF